MTCHRVTGRSLWSNPWGWILAVLCVLIPALCPAGTEDWTTQGDYVIVCQPGDLNISCTDGHTLLVDRAVYGRTDVAVCTEDGGDDQCSEFSEVPELGRICLGSNSCYLTNVADNVIDPCDNSTSYLNVSYVCMPPTSVRSVCDPLLVEDNATSGFISSPGFPLNGSGSCTMTLIPPRGQFFSLDLIYLDWGNSSGCEASYLQLEANSSFKLQYCGDEYPAAELTSINFINVTISYRDQQNHLLFILYYKAFGCLESEIPIPHNGKLLSYTYGTQAEFSCLPGFSLEGTGTVQCVGDVWSGNPGTCRAVECEILSTIPNGQVIQNGVEIGTNVTYRCIAGFRLNAESIRTCLENGTWSGEEPECIKITCIHPGIPENGYAEPGVVIKYPSGTIVSFGCLESYILMGASIIVCGEDGTWNYPAPECIAIDCGHPGDIPNAEISVNQTLLGSNATYTCGPGRDEGVTFVRTCTQNFTWTAPLITCAVPTTTPGEPTISLKEVTDTSKAVFHEVTSVMPVTVLQSNPALLPAVLVTIGILILVIAVIVIYIKFHKKPRISVHPRGSDAVPINAPRPSLDNTEQYMHTGGCEEGGSSVMYSNGVGSPAHNHNNVNKINECTKHKHNHRTTNNNCLSDKNANGVNYCSFQEDQAVSENNIKPKKATSSSGGQKKLSNGVASTKDTSPSLGIVLPTVNTGLLSAGQELEAEEDSQTTYI